MNRLPERPSRPSRVVRLVGAFAAALSALAAVGCREEAAPPAPPPPRVSVTSPAERPFVEYDEYNGWLASSRTVEVRARVRGHIERVCFTDGQLVQAGEVLFELDPRPFQQDVDRAREEIEIYEAQVRRLKLEVERMDNMRRTGVASALEYETAKADLQSREAQAASARAELARRQLELSYAQVTAPIAGRMGRAMMTEGNLVNAGGSDPLLTTIEAIDTLYVYFTVDERTMQRYIRSAAPTTRRLGGALAERGFPFEFGLETDEGHPHQGILDFLDNTVDRMTGTITARGRFDNSTGRLVPGSRVRIRLPLGEASTVLVAPDTAILSDQDRRYVLVVDDQKIVRRREVRLGRLLDDGSRVILPPTNGATGLSPGDSVITLGLQSARVNYPVDIVATP